MARAPRLTPGHRSLALFALTLGVFLVTLNVTVVVVALPSLQSDLGIRSDEAAWVIDAYNLVGASLLLCAGFLFIPTIIVSLLLPEPKSLHE